MTATNKNFDLSAIDRNAAVGLNVVETVTSTEQTLTITPNPFRDVELELKSSDQPWGINRTTGAIGAKQSYDAKIPCKLVIPAGTVPIVFYWIAVSTSATVSVQAK